MPEWRKIFEAEDSDFGGGGLGAMEVCSSTEMGAPGATHLDGWPTQHGFRCVGKSGISSLVSCVDSISSFQFV